MTNKRKKILFFLPSSTGGAERMTVTIAKMLDLEQYEVKFVIVHPTLGTIIDFIPKIYEIIHIPIHNIWCATTIRMMTVIMEEKPDIVFCSLLYLNARLIVAAKLCGVKVIVRNNIDISRTTSKQSKFLVRATYKWADKIVAQQEEMRDEIIRIIGVPTNKVITLHNPIDIESIQLKVNAPSPYIDADNQLKYVCVGRFSQEKGQDILVKAFATVHKKNNNAHLYFIGKYDWNNKFDREIRKYVEDNDLSDCIHFVGFDNNPYRWIKNADVYVMPSRLEGLPNSLIEAMLLGKPVVATHCIPVISRIVNNGYNGYVIPPDNICEMSKAMPKASLLKNFKMTYKSATKEEFINLFK